MGDPRLLMADQVAEGQVLRSITSSLVILEKEEVVATCLATCCRGCSSTSSMPSSSGSALSGDDDDSDGDCNGVGNNDTKFIGLGFVREGLVFKTNTERYPPPPFCTEMKKCQKGLLFHELFKVSGWLVGLIHFGTEQGGNRNTPCNNIYYHHDYHFTFVREDLVGELCTRATNQLLEEGESRAQDQVCKTFTFLLFSFCK